MPPMSQTFLAVALLSTAVVVIRAASVTRGKEVASKFASLHDHAKSVTDKNKIRRAKRHVVFEDVGDDRDTDEAMLRQQLQQLSDAELAALVDIVRDEVDPYSTPQLVAVPKYEIIEIPDDVVDDDVVEVYPRDRRSIPVDWVDPEEPEYFVVPDEAIMEALKQEQDELELRERIAEIAQILNERATRGTRLI